MIALLLFHSAMVLGEPDAMRRFAFQARAFGVKTAQIVFVMQVAMLYAGELRMGMVIDALGPLIGRWDKMDGAKS